MPEAVLGIDAGTGALKAGLFLLDGTVLGLTRVAYASGAREAGNGGEQDPREWWQALVGACRTLVGRADRRLETEEQLTEAEQHEASSTTRVVAVAVGGQAPSLAPVDADLQPTHPAITWLDPRPAAAIEQLYSRLRQEVPVWGSWPGQAAWFVHNRPEALQRTRWLLGCPDYLVSRLVGTPLALLPVTEPELEAGELDARLFPPVWTPGAIVGEVTAAAADATRLPVGTPVVGGHIDGLLGVLGSGVRQPGDACLGGGTSGTLTVVCEPPLGYPMFGMYVAGSASNTSGAALDWYASNIASPGAAYSDLLDAAADVAPGAGGLLFLPHLAGERGAATDAHARGAWVGLTLAHDRRHLLRALLEGVAFSFVSMLNWLESSGAPVHDLRCIGGQAQSALWNQIKADVLGRSVLVPEVVEAAVVGAAMLGAVAVGRFADLDAAARAMLHVARRFEPHPPTAAAYARLFETYSSLYPTLRETNWALHRWTDA